jgi:hypothetical protein
MRLADGWHAEGPVGATPGRLLEVSLSLAVILADRELY